MSTFINSFWKTFISGQYKFEETTGTTVVDSLGRFDGVRYNATMEAIGGINKCYSYNGIDARVEIPNNLGITSFPFSVAFYVRKYAASDSVLAVNSREINKYIGFDIDIRANGIYAGYGNGVLAVPQLANRKSFFASTAVINDTLWHRVSVEFIDFNTIKIYLDSVYRTTTYNSGAATSIAFPNIINIMNDKAINYWSRGSIDELSFFNRLLNADEI